MYKEYNNIKSEMEGLRRVILRFASLLCFISYTVRRRSNSNWRYCIHALGYLGLKRELQFLLSQCGFRRIVEYKKEFFFRSRRVTSILEEYLRYLDMCEDERGLQQVRSRISLQRLHRIGYRKPKKKKKKSPLDGKPFAKGVVLKTVIKKPKKPNSANRKCVVVRLSTGREMTAYVPGEGHNLQEHNIVLCRVGRLQDVPGVKIKCVRGVYDLPHVIKKKK